MTLLEKIQNIPNPVAAAVSIQTRGEKMIRSEARYGIRWIETGCKDDNLTRGEVIEMARENGAEWVEGDIVENGTNKKIGRVYRTDDNF